MKRDTVFKIGNDVPVFENRFVKIFDREFTNTRTGTSGKWTMIKRPITRPIVGCVALTAEHEVVFVRNYRVPVGKFVYEPIMGLPDPEDLDGQSTAVRELCEETGHMAKTWVRLAEGVYNPGMLGDTLEYYLGLQAHEVCAPKREDAEDMDVVKVRRSEVMEFLLAPEDGVVVDLKLFGLLALVHRYWEEHLALEVRREPLFGY